MHRCLQPITTPRAHRHLALYRNGASVPSWENGAGVPPTDTPCAYRNGAGVSLSAKGAHDETETALFSAGDSSLQRRLSYRLPDTSL